MFCPGCGNPVTSGGRFCFNCGAALPVTQAAALAGDGRDEETAESRSARRSGGDSFAGQVIEGKYRLEERIGVGGMGTVYRATRLLIGDTVAVKLMHAEFMRDSEAERFRREAQAAARLKHPNAVGVYDFGLTPEGMLYLVMELVEGESLRQLIKRRGTLEPETACRIVSQVCAALDEAHHRHIVHRDIKPDNVIVHSTPKGVRVKVLDFGVAKLRDVPTTTLTQTGNVVGTPHYMSPEQCLGEEIDQRSDIYSVGIVLYEMLCGSVPFNSPISTAVIVQHVNQAPPSLRGKNSAVAPALERAVMRALEKNREARPQTAGALADEVEAALAGRAWSEELTWEAEADESATADSPRHRSPLNADEQTAPRGAGRPPRADGPAAQLAPTEILRAPASVSGRVSPLLAPGGVSSKGTSDGRLRRIVLLSAAASILVALFGGLAVWMSGKGGTGAESPAGANANGTSSSTQNAGGDTKSERGARGQASASSPQPPAGMAYVAGGVFTMGRDGGDEYESPPHKVTVKPFYIDKYEVTCEDYARFLREASYKRLPAGWRDNSCPPGSERLPVTGVTWDDAVAYARWAGKRLPTEEEWEFAARGTDGRLYPWGGDKWRAGVANAGDEGKSRGGVAEVGKYSGASPFGVYDMAGNAWEWTASPLAAYPGGRLPPQRPGEIKVIRGGYWGSRGEYVRATYRGGLARDESVDNRNTGFRCAKDTAQ